MTLFRRKAEHAAEHKRAQKDIAEIRADIVDMTKRLVRLEAEAGIYTAIQPKGPEK